MRRIALVGLFASLLVVGFELARAAEDKFSPIKASLRTPSTDRVPVDIEIVGSTSMVPNQHRLEPDRVLRLRLERAFIGSFLTQDAPGFSILSIGIDRPTSLPISLIIAVSRHGRFHEDIPGVPALEPVEQGRRQVWLEIQSSFSERSFVNLTVGSGRCKQQPVGDDLWEIEQETKVGTSPCSHSVYPQGRKWRAALPDAQSAIIECEEPEGSVCKTRFVFQGFAVETTFHQSLLHQWKDVVAFARDFLTAHLVN